MFEDFCLLLWLNNAYDLFALLIIVDSSKYVVVFPSFFSSLFGSQLINIDGIGVDFFGLAKFQLQIVHREIR